MRDIDVLKLEADASYKELLLSLEGLDERQAWAVQLPREGEYMHTEGSILSEVLHVAGGKFLYGSAAYRGLEIRWRDIVARLEEFWPDWPSALAYLQEAQDYWLATWTDEVDLERAVKTFHDKEWPSWKIIWTINHHDSYHAGQIQMLRSILPPSELPPLPEGDQWRKACQTLPSW